MHKSANGTTSHIPLIEKICGRIAIPRRKKNRLREKEMMADILPLDRAVKRAEVNILLPLNKKLKAKILKPFKVIS